MRESLKMGFVVALIFGVGVTVTGDLQAKVMTEQQPMKMAAAEAIWDTQAPASFSVFTIGTPDGESELFSAARAVPAVVSWRPGDFNGEVEGIRDVQRDSEERFGPGDYRPIIPVTYWSFRYMIGFGMRDRGAVAARPVPDARRAQPGGEEVVLPRRRCGRSRSR